MKYAKLKVVQSTCEVNVLSIRGPKGVGRSDSAKPHITAAGFQDGDIVYLISEEDFKLLEELK